MTSTNFSQQMPSQIAHTNLEAVATPKGFNRYLIVTKEGKLEQTHFLKAWGEDIKGLFGVPNFRDKHLIKLKTLQLVASLGKEWKNISSELLLIKSLVKQAGLGNDPEFQFLSIIETISSSILKEGTKEAEQAAAEIINTTFAGALDAYQFKHRKQLEDRFSQKVLNIREVVHRALSEIPIMSQKKEETNAEIPLQVSSESIEKLVKVEALISQEQRKWSSIKKIGTSAAKMLAGIGTLFVAWYAYRSLGTGEQPLQPSLTEGFLGPSSSPIPLESSSAPSQTLGTTQHHIEPINTTLNTTFEETVNPHTVSQAFSISGIVLSLGLAGGVGCGVYKLTRKPEGKAQAPQLSVDQPSKVENVVEKGPEWKKQRIQEFIDFFSDEKNLKEEGVTRENTNKIDDRFNVFTKRGLAAGIEGSPNPAYAAGVLLKKFVKECKLCTAKDDMPLFLAMHNNDQDQLVLQKIRDKINLMDVDQKQLLLDVMKICRNILNHKESNRMNEIALATAWADTFFYDFQPNGLTAERPKRAILGLLKFFELEGSSPDNKSAARPEGESKQSPLTSEEQKKEKLKPVGKDGRMSINRPTASSRAPSPQSRAGEKEPAFHEPHPLQRGAFTSTTLVSASTPTANAEVAGSQQENFQSSLRKRLDSLAAADTPEEVFQQLLPEGASDVNPENSREVARILDGFLQDGRAQLDRFDIESLRTLKKVLSKIHKEQSSPELDEFLSKMDVLATKLIMELLPPGVWSIAEGYAPETITKMTLLPSSMTQQRVEAMTESDIQQLANEYLQLEDLNEFYINEIKSFFAHAAKEPEKIHWFFYHYCKLVESELDNLEANGSFRDYQFDYLQSPERTKFQSLLMLLPSDLETLNLTQCRVRRFDFVEGNFLEKVSKLKELNLSDCRLGYLDIEFLDGKCTSLLKLDLSDNDLSTLPVSLKSSEKRIYKTLKRENFPKLKQLILRNCKLNDHHYKRIRHSLPGVEVLGDSTRAEGPQTEEQKD